MLTLDANLQAVARANSPDGKLHDVFVELDSGKVIQIHFEKSMTDPEGDEFLARAATLIPRGDAGARRHGLGPLLPDLFPAALAVTVLPKHS